MKNVKVKSFYQKPKQTRFLSRTSTATKYVCRLVKSINSGLFFKSFVATIVAKLTIIMLFSYSALYLKVKSSMNRTIECLWEQFVLKTGI